MATGASATDSMCDAIINTMRSTTLTAWTPYASLHTTQTTDAGGGTEVSTGGGSLYAREAITWGAPAAASPSGRVTLNTSAVQFPTAGANWGTIVALGVWTSVTVGAGTMNYWGTLSFSVTINSGQTRSFDVSDLSLLHD